MCLHICSLPWILQINLPWWLLPYVSAGFLTFWGYSFCSINLRFAANIGQCIYFRLFFFFFFLRSSCPSPPTRLARSGLLDHGVRTRSPCEGMPLRKLCESASPPHLHDIDCARLEATIIALWGVCTSVAPYLLKPRLVHTILPVGIPHLSACHATSPVPCAGSGPSSRSACQS